ncbi:hypothetical protein [Sphingomonas sp. Root710]|uniref:hypothetical protein n=1 Tax=Sphingomonas sp. Root710 TaxID=1736594 RepID=UPI00138F9A2E|nr:hypothetical protein [Sphingomonas sp. Root710]
MRSKVRPSILFQRLLLAVLCAYAGYFLADILLVDYVQDANQYRLNLDNGVYHDDYNVTLFALSVRTIVALLPNGDPFLVLGSFTCATYIYLALRSSAPWYKIAIFLIFLPLPLMEFNYTQVIRQGVATALLLIALFSNNMIASSILFALGGAMHLSYAPFAAIAFVRTVLTNSVDPLASHRTKRETRFDRAIFFAIPAIWIILALYQDILFSADRVDIYISYNLDLFKRLSASIMMIGIAWLIYPKSDRAIGSFMAYVTVSVAIILPFTYDFLRMQTYNMPFILFAALTCRDSRRSIIALIICLILSIYIRPEL